MTSLQNKEMNIRPGKIVKLRRRTWRVENIAGGILNTTPIDNFGSRAQQFLLTLDSPQPGNLAEPSLQFLDDNTLQSLFLQAVRLDALPCTAPFVSIQRTSVIPVEYQLVPLVMALPHTLATRYLMRHPGDIVGLARLLGHTLI